MTFNVRQNSIAL